MELLKAFLGCLCQRNFDKLVVLGSFKNWKSLTSQNIMAFGKTVVTGDEYMAHKNSAVQIREKIRETVETLGKALNDWLTKQGLTPRPVPIPINRPGHNPRRKKRKVA